MSSISGVQRDVNELVRRGLGMSGAVDFPALSVMRSLVPDRSAAAEEILVSLRETIPRALALLGSEEQEKAALALLGIEPKGGSLNARAEHAAISLDVRPDTFRRPDGRPRRRAHLETLIAQALVSFESRFEQESILAASTELANQLGVNWLSLFQNYYSPIATDLSGLGSELRVLRLKTASAALKERKPLSSMWFFARFLVNVYDYVQRGGGLWILPDANKEVRLRDAVYAIEWHAPFDELQKSTLREALRESPNRELTHFAVRCDQDPEVAHLLRAWRREICDACNCRTQPSPQCELHAVIDACETYTTALDEAWYTVANWYRRPPSDAQGVQALDLHRQYRE